MEKGLIIYKGDYTGDVAGVALRYVSVANELEKKGIRITIAGKKVPGDTDKIKYINTSNLFTLTKQVFKSDFVILHGGGPIILAVLAFYNMFKNKKVLLDSFAPHWLELYSSPNSLSLKYRAKIAFNILRLSFGALYFSHHSVGTPRQLDLIRGYFASVGNLDGMNKIAIITGGCAPSTCENESTTKGYSYQKQGKDTFDFGWLGGLWDWFDINPVLKALAQANKVKNTRLHFFGVSENKTKEVVDYLENNNLPKSIVEFHPWVPYMQRFSHWEGIDAAIVWASSKTLENDYASRTRNFDCLTLGIPIIQNVDFFWSEQIKSLHAGIVATESELPASIITFLNQNNLTDYRKGVEILKKRYVWEKIAIDYLSHIASTGSRTSYFSKFLGLFSILTFFLQQFFTLKKN